MTVTPFLQDTSGGLLLYLKGVFQNLHNHFLTPYPVLSLRVRHRSTWVDTLPFSSTIKQSNLQKEHARVHQVCVDSSYVHERRKWKKTCLLMYFSIFFALHVYWGTSSNVTLSQKCFPLLLRRHCVIFVWFQKKLIFTEINFSKAYFLRELKFVYFAFWRKSTRNILKNLKSIEIRLYNVLLSKLLLYWKICLSLFKLRKKPL